MPDNLSTIGQAAFCDCESLNKIVLPENIVSIEDRAFCDCPNLSLFIPDGVTSIGSLALLGCKEVYCKPSTPPSLEVSNDNGQGRPLPKVYVPTKSVNAYKRAKGWKEYYADQIVGYDF